MYTTVAFAVFITLSICGLVTPGLQKDFHYTRDYDEDTGHLSVHSEGRFADVVFLDEEDSIKKLKCDQWKLTVIGKNSTFVGKNWTKGQIIIGGPRWDCFLNSFGLGQKGIIGKIVQVKLRQYGRSEVFLESIRPLDILVEANISVKYSPAKNISQVETKRNETSSFHLGSRDLATRAEGNHITDVKYVTKVPRRTQLDIQPSNTNSGEENLDMSMKLTSCLKKSEITYSTKMVLKRNEIGHTEISLLQNHNLEIDETSRSFPVTDREADRIELLKLSNSKKQGDTPLKNNKVNLNYESHIAAKLNIFGQMMADDVLPISEQPQRKLVTVPVVEATKGLPAILLNVIVNTDTRMKTHILARAGQSHLTMSVAAGSDILFDLHEKDGLENPVRTTAEKWTLKSLGDKGVDTEQHLQANIEVSHRFSVESQLSVLMEDVYPLYKFGMNFGVSPTITVKSSRTDVARKLDLVSSLGIYTNNTHGEDKSQHTRLGEKTLHSNARPACDLTTKQQENRLSMDDVSGKMVKKIMRGDSNFKKLYQIHGDFVLFASEEAKDSWCSHPNQKCVSCTHQIVGDTDDTKCADRMMTTQMALHLSKMAEMASYTWPDRKLVVLEAWDEATSEHPIGSHGVSSPFYEGRAAYVALSQPITPESDKSKQTTKLDNSESILGILGRLANCSGFPFVRRDISGGFVEVSVKADVDLKPKKDLTLGETIFDVVMKEKGAAECETIFKTTFPSGSSWPINLSEVDVCGAADNPIKRNDIDQYSKLYEYPFDDVIFAEEGDSHKWCGSRMRRCLSDCSSKTGNGDLWRRCSTRVMSRRLAIKLRLLTNLVEAHLKSQKSTFTKPVIKVEIGHREPEETKEPFHHLSELYTEGRGLRLSLMPQKNIDLEKLSLLSICADFDYIAYSSNNYIEVFVKKQVGFLPTVIDFPSAHLLAVEPPPVDREEYALPESVIGEGEDIPLFDGTDRTVALSRNFKIKDFVFPGIRYFRLDPLLVSCLEATRDATPVEFRILPGSTYRTATTKQAESRHPEEAVRYRAGQAVEIETRKADDLLELAQTVVRSCSMTFISLGRGMGCGLHADRLYLDIRPIFNEEFMQLWNSGGNLKIYDQLKAYVSTVQKGGSIIQPLNPTLACKPTFLGPDLYYLALNEDSDLCDDSDIPETCSETGKRREEENKNFITQLISAAGISALEKRDIAGDTRKCLVTLCGGCSGFGRVWAAKMKACAKVIQTFIKKASRPFPELKDRVGFYNNGATDSKVHHLACDGESLCIDEIPLNAMLVTLLESKYKPKEGVTVEELLFGGEDNPTPLLQIVEQELAMHAVGDVSVFIESDDDLSILRNVIKILMMYNSKVDIVRFYLTNDVRISSFISSLRRKLNNWSYSVCPKHSRLAVTPFKVENISADKQKRSIEGSRARNERKWYSKNWEIQWLESL